MHKKILRFSFKASVLATALAVLPMGANAAGLGKITVLSALGQPLRAEVELTASREELSSLSARLASSEAFRQAGIEFVPALSGIKLAIDKRTGGQPVIRMTTSQPVNEPFLDLLIELNWTAGRLVREYTFLLDPAPEVLARKPVAAPVAKPEAAPVAQPAPVASPKQPEVRAEEKKPRAEKAEEPMPAGAAQGREVKKGEYLRKIAAEAQYDGVSLDQMLVAIFRSNKDAFIGNNMNRMKAGKILNIPDRDTVAALDGREARKTISAHTADFNAYRQKLASAAAGSEAPKEEAAKQVATGKIGAKVEDKAPAPAETKDQLKVSKAEAAKDARAAQGKIVALEEDLAAKERALKEAQSRQADLEKNLKELQKLVELKNQNLAELQKQAAAKAAPPPAPEVKKPEAPPPAAPAKAPETAPAAAAPAVAPVPAAAGVDCCHLIRLCSMHDELTHAKSTAQWQSLYHEAEQRLAARTAELAALRAQMQAEIATRQQAETALQANDARFAALINSAMDAIISVDEELRVVLFNTAAELMFGYTRAEMLGAPLDTLIPTRFHHDHTQHLRRFGAMRTTARSMGALGASTEPSAVHKLVDRSTSLAAKTFNHP